MGTSLCKDIVSVDRYGQAFNINNQSSNVNDSKVLQEQNGTNQVNQQHHNKQINQKNIAFQFDQIVLITTPELSTQIKQFVLKNTPFQGQLSRNPKVINYKQHIFEGQLDQKQLPTGYGKLYLANGDFLIGRFSFGQINGQAQYIFQNGDYYKGTFKNNMLSTQSGQYHSKNLHYQGSFRDFLFNGEGKQIGTDHQFLGTYQNGKKKQGVLMWNKHHETDQYDFIYQGKFNQFQEFDGLGNLQQLKGIYEGSFLNGEKHGKGTYSYKYGLQYVGSYINGLKQGEGTLFNDDGTIGYSGQWKNGYPDGEGYIVDQQGKKHVSHFKRGVHTKLIL